MKKILFAILTSICVFSNAQITPPIVKSSLTTSNGLKINSRKSTLTEKEIIQLSKFKNLNFQKIVLKDLSDNTTETVMGIMTEYETFDNISRKTLTVEKNELSKLIESFQTLEKKQKETIGESVKKYKFTLMNNLEFGAIYKESSKSWVNYYIFPAEFYSKSIYEFSTDELRELIKLLKKVEKDL